MHNLNTDDVYNHINENINIYNTNHNLNYPIDYYMNDILNQYNNHNPLINIPFPQKKLTNL